MISREEEDAHYKESDSKSKRVVQAKLHLFHINLILKGPLSLSFFLIAECDPPLRDTYCLSGGTRFKVRRKTHTQVPIALARWVLKGKDVRMWRLTSRSLLKILTNCG